MGDPLALVNKLHQLLIKAYPPEYREVFGYEVHQTFQDGIKEARAESRLSLFLLRELLDTPKVLITAYGHEWGKKLLHRMQRITLAACLEDLPPAPPDGRTSWLQALFELIPFLSLGIILVVATYLPFENFQIGWKLDVIFLGKVIGILILPIFVFGLLRGLPRWAYPAGGLFLGYQIIVLQQTALWLFLLSMLFVSCFLGIAAIVTDPIPHRLPITHRKILQSLLTDWSRFSFACYGAMPLVLLAAFDDSHSNNQTLYFAFSVMAMIAGALIYCRSREKSLQIAALLFGLTFCIFGALLDSLSQGKGLENWIIVASGRNPGNLWILKLWFQWIIIFLSPTLFVFLSQVLKQKQQAME